jgi:hypothetical protein
MVNLSVFRDVTKNAKEKDMYHPLVRILIFFSVGGIG